MTTFYNYNIPTFSPNFTHGGDFKTGKLAPKSKFHLEGWSFIELLLRKGKFLQ